MHPQLESRQISPPRADATADALALPGGIALSGVARRFGSRIVLEALDLQLAAGGRLGIVGRSGVGKSTLLSLVAGLDAPDAGEVSVWGDSSAAGRLRRCVLMPQRDCLLPWRSALDNAGLGLENQGVPRVEARRRAVSLFKRLGLDGAERLRPAQLSGGMRQRVAFARTLLVGKQVLLLDEPFGALDAITRVDLQQWLGTALDAEPRTVVLVTHDVEEALLLCDRVAVLTDGSVSTIVPAYADRRAPRREIVTQPQFIQLRERVLEALA